MIMKRKLPSQSKKFEEETLQKQAEQGAPNTEQPTAATEDDNTAPPAASSVPPVHTPSFTPSFEEPTTLDAPTHDDDPFAVATPQTPKTQAFTQHVENEEENPFETLAPTDQNTEEDANPFLALPSDEDSMTLDNIPTRPHPEEEAEKPFIPIRKRTVSTEALLETRKPVEISIPKAVEASKAEKPEDQAVDTLFPQKAALTLETPEDDADDSWDLSDLVQLPQDAHLNTASPFMDDANTKDAAPTPTSEVTPKAETPKNTSWGGKKSAADKKRHKTILPNLPTEASPRTGAVISLVVVGSLVGGLLLFYQNRDIAVETISRWTGTLNEVGRPVPATSNFETAENIQENALQAESTIQVEGLSTPQEAAENTSNISLTVLDVAPDEAHKPIIADGSENIPEELDKFTALQEAIARKRSEKREREAAKLAGDPADLDLATLPPEEITRRNLEIIRQTNESLEEYKKALAQVNDPALKPRPGSFLEEKRRTAASLLPSPEGEFFGTDAPLPPAEPILYGNFVVNNLAELAASQKQQQDSEVRTLDDFDVALFDHGRQRVSIPKGLVPRLSAEDFPPLEVLSFVAGQGLIAKAHGKEGILLLGETLEGWELVAVQNSYAEFQKDGKKRIVTFKNANR